MMFAVAAKTLPQITMVRRVTTGLFAAASEKVRKAYLSEEPSAPPQSPGFESVAQYAILFDTEPGALNILSLHEPAPPTQESLIIDATTGTLKESSLTKPESLAFSQPAKAKYPEVIDLIDSSSDQERESSLVVASSSEASQTIELVSSGDDESSELLQEGKNPFVARPFRPTFCSNSSSSSSEERDSNDSGAFESSFLDDNESVEEQSVKPASTDDEEEEDSDDNDEGVEQLVQRTNRIFISSDGDSSTEVDSVEDFRPAKQQSEAKKFVSEAAFRRSRETMGAETFVAFDNAAFGGRLGAAQVTLEWSNKLRTTAGMARLRKTRRPGCPSVLSASIELSTKVVDDPHRLRSTLLHEMCHAAAWMIDGVSKPPHGKCFQKWARIAMTHVPDMKVTTTHNFQISFKHAWACTTSECGFIVKRHSRSVDVNKHRCGRCQGKLMEIEVPLASNASGTNVEHALRKKAPPSAYNVFIKDNSAPVRKQLEAESSSKVSQPEVMKACARLWREQIQSKK